MDTVYIIYLSSLAHHSALAYQISSKSNCPQQSYVTSIFQGGCRCLKLSLPTTAPLKC